MNTNQKGFAVPLLVAIISLLVIGCGLYVYSNKKTTETLKNTRSSTPDLSSFALTDHDIANLTYPVYVNDNGRYGSVHDLLFSGIGDSFKVAIERVGERETGAAAIEYFWITGYTYTDSSHTEAKVAVKGTFGIGGQDDRISDVSKINGNLEIKAEPSI